MQLAAKRLGLSVEVFTESCEEVLPTLDSLASPATRLGLLARVLTDWTDVDAALSAGHPVILLGDSRGRNSYGKRLGNDAESATFLLLSERASTLFPTTGGPFATETVSYLAHIPHYRDSSTWICVGELRGFCNAVSGGGLLATAFSRTFT